MARDRARGALRLELIDARSPRVEELWRQLEAMASPPATYFLSWGWVENWLSTLPPDEAPQLAALFEGERLAGGFFVGSAVVLRHRLLPTRAYFLNATGFHDKDELCIEHNGVLWAGGAEASAAGLAELVELLPGGWDELVLPALDADGFPGRALGGPLGPYHVVIDREVSAPFVDLGQVRAASGGYLSLLCANTRAQIRRAQRGFGALTVEEARDEQQAMDIYDELTRLHQARWREQGEPGAFADRWFDAFHRRLIAQRFATGEIQLLRVRAKGATVGCLYNFVHHGRVLFYQSGFAPQSDARLKAGYVCHAEAVGLNALAGHSVYDFLGGDSRYKRSLATGERRLLWARVQRTFARFAVERCLRLCRQALARGAHAAALDEA